MADSPVSLEQFLQNRQRERDSNDYLRNSVSRAADVQDPDRYASQLADAQQYGLPVSAVESGVDDVRRQQFLDEIDVEDIRTNYPGTASFLAADPDNAILSRDSILGLKNLERALNEDNFFERRANDFRRGVDRLQQGDAFGMIVMQSENLQRLQELQQSLEAGEFDLQQYTRQAGFERAIDADEFARLSPEQRQAKIDSVQRALDKSINRLADETRQIDSRTMGTARTRYEQSPDFMSALGEFVRSPIEIGTSIATESFGQFLPALPFMALGPTGAAVGSGMTSLMGEYHGDMIASLEESGVDLTNREQLLNALQDEEALARWKQHALARSVPISLIDAFSAGIAGRLTAAARTPGSAARRGAAESLLIQPGLGGLGEAAGSVAAGDEIDGKAILSEMIGELPTGTIETGVGYMSARADAARLTAQRSAADMLQSLGEQQQLDSWVERAQGIKLSQRAQDRFKNFLDGVSKKIDSVYISGDAVRQLLEDGIMLPDYLSSTDGLTDIEVPIRTFLAEIATNEKLIEQLRPHVKLSPNTQTRAQLTSKDGDESLRKIVEQASKAGETKREADRIYDEIKDQLVATERMDETTARYSAQLIPAYVTTVAERYGIPVQEVYDMMRLSIRGPQQGQQTGGTTLFEPGTPAFEKWFGDSKVVDETGEPLVVYHGSTVRGVTEFDTSRVTSRTADGDLPGTYFTSDARAAFNYTRPRGAKMGTPRGEVVAAYLSIKNPLNTTSAIAQFRKEGLSFGDAKRKALEALTPEHDGVIFDGDENNASEYVVFRPEQIKSATGNRGTYDPNDPNILNQARADGYEGFDVREANEWSLAVDDGLDMSHEARMQRAQEMGFDTGTVWYHGTQADFGQFDAGANTSPGFFFTTSPELADKYTKRGFTSEGGNIIPVYLRTKNTFDTQNPVHINAFIEWAKSRIASGQLAMKEYQLDEFVELISEVPAFMENPTVQQFIRENGYDSYFTMQEEGNRVISVLDPANIRSTMAAFNPEMDGTAWILGQSPVQTPQRAIPDEAVFQPAVDAAKEYARISGIPYRPITTRARVDVGRAERIARAYEEMEHAPNDPKVKAAYKALIDETIEQYRVILKTGIELHWIKETDPYAESPRLAIHDVVENNRLYVYPTRAGFGSDQTFDPADNPLLAETEFKIDGETMLANDVFRVVHDYFGHVKANVGFRAVGEENAWQQHAAMYSPLARQALTTETRGQNSWVNFGPHAEHNRTASAADTIYADQKTGLMPEWTSEEGRIDTPTVREDDTILLTHYTTSDKLKFIDPKKYGSSLSSRGAESVRADMDNWMNRSFYGINVGEEGGYRKEAGLGSNVYYSTVKQGELYDYRRDPNNLFREDPDEFPEQNINDYERRIKRAGYKGYWVKDDQLGMVAAVFERLPANTEPPPVETPEPATAAQKPKRRATLFQRLKDTFFPADDTGLYSGLGRFVEEVNLPQWKKEDGQARGADVWAKISKAPLKKEELQWVGIEEFLTADPDAKFTRAAVMAYIRNNGVRIEEVRADQTDVDLDNLWGDPQELDNQEEVEYQISDLMEQFDGGNEWNDGWIMDWIDDNIEKVIDAFDAGEFEGADTVANMEELIALLDANGITVTPLRVASRVRPLARDDYQEDYANEEGERRAQDNVQYRVDLISDSDYYIIGNNNYGWTFHGPDGYTQGEEYSLSEAQTQARVWLEDRGIIAGEGSPTTAKWGEHVMEGTHDNYRELKLTLPYIDDDFYYSSHFDDRNILAFLRVTDRKLSDGSEPAVTEYPAGTIRVEKREPTGAYPEGLVEIYSGDERLHTLRTPHTAEQVRKIIAEAKADLSVGPYRTDGKGGLKYTAPEISTRKNTYFIDEFQSDWASEGRKHGFIVDQETREQRKAEAEEKLTEFREATARLYDNIQEANRQSGTFSGTEGFVELVNPVTGARVGVPSDVDGLMSILTSAYTNIHERGPKHHALLHHEGGEVAAAAAKAYSDALTAQAQAENSDVPPAPFVMNDNWLTLGLKRAIVDAVQTEYEAIAWPNSSTLESRWSSGYDYSPQYDKKMVSIIKKLTGVEPVQVDTDGERIPSEKEWRADKEIRPMAGETDMFTVYSKSGDNLVVGGFATEESAQQWIDDIDPRELATDGYWIVPITDQLRERIQTEGGFSMFQENRGSIELLDNRRIIRLSEASDASTFLHEAGHLFLEMEKQLAAKYGMSSMHRSILNYLGAKSFDDLDPTTPAGIAKHEKFARAFEAYLREGKAPSLGLRDAFAAFARWLKIIYRQLTSLNVTLDDSIREVFDHMLATEAEIEAAAANPAYDKFFESKEAAGMTTEEWVKYMQRVDKAKNRAQGDIDQKLLKQLRDRRTAEWREEKQPLVDEAREQLSNEPVYKILNETADEPMDYDQVIAIYGKIPGKMIGKARKGGIDPQEYAEVHGFRTVMEMLQAIDDAPSLGKAADEQAEQIMKQRHGDILNDGTLEQEVLDAMHNEGQVELLLEQLRVLNNQRRRKTNTDQYNREYLKAEAKRVVSSMTYNELKPNKYYQAEIRAAQNAVRETDPDKRFDFKVQQLVNHYLYREASDVRERMERQRKYVRGVQTRTYDSKTVDPSYIQNMKTLSNLYDMRDKDAKVQAIESILNWYTAQINDPNQFVKVELMDPNLVLALEARERGEVASLNLPHFDDLTADDLQGLYDMLRLMRHVGGKQGDQAKLEMAADRAFLRESIIDNGGRDVKGTRGVPDKWESFRRWSQHLVNRLPSLRNLIRRLDDTFDDPTATGEAWKLIYQPIEQANSAKIGLNRQVYERSVELFDGIHRIGLDRSKNSAVTLPLENGGEWTLHTEHRFMLALYWGTESSRQAVRDGFNATDADVQAMLETLTTDQLRMVNKVWEFNETLWPDLSSASVKVYGVAPPKLDPQPFLVNGVPMTGGHMRLIYDSQELELKTERDKAALVTSVMPTKAGSLHARVGSGGRPPLLDKNNISRAMADSIHFIAFGEVGHRLNGLVSSREVRGAIERKHGPGFYRALLETIDGITGGRAEREPYPGIAVMSRMIRHAATFKHLAYSIRNTVQQVTALFPVAQEIGTVNMVATYAEYLMPEGRRTIQEFANERSEFMRDRTAVVNREASENLRQIAMPAGWTESGWQTYKQFGFAMQTLVDKHIAYPTWIAKYRQVMLETGDEARAISAADTAVGESVGSGSDLHLGGAFQSTNTEAIRMFTVFGSWFNAYYQRIYRDTRGFSGWTNRSFGTLVSVPILTAITSSLIIMDGPDEEEEWWEYLLTNYLGFMAGTVPVVRDIASVSKGFTPKTPLTSAVELPVAIVREFESGVLDDEIDPLGSALDATGAVTNVVPVPGSGQLLRMADYLESYYQGEEGEFNAYQMVVEGKDKNR